MTTSTPIKLIAAALGMAWFSLATAIDPLPIPVPSPQFNPGALQQHLQADPLNLQKRLHANLAITDYQTPRTLIAGDSGNASISVRNPSTQETARSVVLWLALVDRDLSGQDIEFAQDSIVAQLGGISLNPSETRQYNLNFTVPAQAREGDKYLCAKAYLAAPSEPQSLKVPDNLLCRPLRINPRPAQYCPAGRLSFRGDINSRNNCRGSITASVQMHELGQFDNGVFDIVQAPGSQCVVTHGSNLRGNLNERSAFQGEMRQGNQVVTIRFAGATDVPRCSLVRGSFSIDAPVNDQGDFMMFR